MNGANRMEYTTYTEQVQMSREMIREMNSRLFFQTGKTQGNSRIRPWQYVEMEYRRMGLTPPSRIPALDSLEDAEIWMCLDERVNYSLRMRENSLAG